MIADNLIRPAEVAATRRGLVNARWLHAHLGDPDVRVVEVDVNPTAYAGGHIPGAVLWDIYGDLKDADYHLIDAESCDALISACGIGRDDTVVVYGYGAAIGLWLLKLRGHRHVRLLDCSRAAWMQAGLAWTDELPALTAAPTCRRTGDGSIRATTDDVCAAIAAPASILDVRSGAEFRGERFWPSGAMEPNGRAGRIPSAIHVPLDGIVDDSGAFCDTETLRRIFAGVDLAGDATLITYCTIGARACTAWFALTYLLGRSNVRVYDGSWAEWGRLRSVPVATN